MLMIIKQMRDWHKPEMIRSSGKNRVQTMIVTKAMTRISKNKQQ